MNFDNLPRIKSFRFENDNIGNYARDIGFYQDEDCGQWHRSAGYNKLDVMLYCAEERIITIIYDIEGGLRGPAA